MKNGYARYKNTKNVSVFKTQSQGHKKETKIYQNVKEKIKKRGRKEVKKNHFPLGFLQELSMCCDPPQPPLCHPIPSIYVTFTGGQRAMECVFAPHCVGRPELCRLSCRARGPRVLHQPWKAQAAPKVGSAQAGSSCFSPFLVPIPFSDAGRVNSGLGAPSQPLFPSGPG